MTKISFDLCKPHWRHSILCLVLLYCCFAGDPLVAAGQKDASRTANRTNSLERGQPSVEEFDFYLKDFKMDHQGEAQTLNIRISLLYVSGIRNTAYPDFRLIARDVEAYLNKYPNKTDYWEILNKRMAQLILDKYPVISRVTSEIEVSASPLVPYVRASTVTRLRRTKGSVAAKDD